MTDEEKRLKEISDSFTCYNDSLPDEEIAEDRAWAQLAMAQLAQAVTKNLERLESETHGTCLSVYQPSRLLPFHLSLSAGVHSPSQSDALTSGNIAADS